MKKPTIICLIVSFVLIVLGLSLVVIGLMFGGFGQVKTIMEQNMYVSDDVISTYVYKVNYLEDENSGFDDWEINGSYEISSNEIKTLEIDIKEGYLVMEEHIGDSIQIVVKGEGKITVTEKNGKVNIEQKNSLTDTECAIFISLPAGKNFDEVILSAGGGVINIDSIYAKNLELDIGVSSVKIEQLESEEMEAEIGAGQLEIVNGQVEDAQVSVGIGSFIWSGNISEQLEVDCGMGAIEMLLDDEEENYNYEIECAMGNIEIGDTSYSGVFSKNMDHMGANKKVELECGIGSIKIEFTE